MDETAVKIVGCVVRNDGDNKLIYMNGLMMLLNVGVKQYLTH